MKIDASSPAPAVSGDRIKLEQAAVEFETLLLSQMLRSAREASSEENATGGAGMGSESIMEIAEQQMAKLLAAAGGLGMAKTVVEQTDASGAL